MGRLLIALLAGLLLGATLTFYLFVGVPQSVLAPGVPIKPLDTAGAPPGTAQIVLRQEFFNDVLAAIFTKINAPSFPLGPNAAESVSPSGEACAGNITILAEGSGVRTGINFENNRLTSPLAFTGGYNSPFGCVRFNGWAQANLDLRFDAANKVVYGQINVEAVNLDGVNPIVGALLTPIVQSTINARINPIQILDGRKIAMNLPIAAVKGNLLADVTDVRAEVRENALNLYVVYEFNGAAYTPPAQPLP